MKYSQTDNSNHNQIEPQTMQLGAWRQTSHPNFNNHRGRRNPPTHRQGQYNTTRDRQIYPDEEG